MHQPTLVRRSLIAAVCIATATLAIGCGETPLDEPECTSGADCETDQICEDEQCVPLDEPQCEDDADCEVDQVCSDDRCIPCQEVDECPELTFGDLEIPEIGTDSATFQSELEELPVEPVTDHGFCWATDEQPTLDDACTRLGEADEAGPFSATVDDLEETTDYYLRAFAVVDEETTYSDQKSFATASVDVSPPGGVEATTDRVDDVIVSWEAADDAAEYAIYRDDELVDEIEDDGSATFSVADHEADPGTTPTAPTDLTVTETTEMIRIEWTPSDVDAGSLHEYTVRALGPDRIARSSATDDGRRAAAPVDTYEIRSSTDGSSWTDFDEVTEPNTPAHDDLTAPEGAITDIGPGGTSASEGTSPDYVELETPEADATAGDEIFYELQGVNAIGPGDSASAAGRRAVGEPEYHWEYLVDGDYQPVPDCDGSRQCNDSDAPADGTPRDYRVVVRADGADDETIDAGSGYVAVLELAWVEQSPTEATAGEAFDVQLELINQDTDRVEYAGVEVDLLINQNSFAAGTTTIDDSTDSEGLVAFEPAIEEATSGYRLIAGGDHPDLAGQQQYGDFFEVVAADASTADSSITGEPVAHADGEDAPWVDIELFDEFGNPVVGVVPQFSATGSGNNYQSCSPTDASGFSECSMTSTDPGDKILEITDPISTTGSTIEFLPDCRDDDEWYDDWKDFEQPLIEEVNEVRTEGVMCGDEWFPPVDPLDHDSRLTEASRCHTADMLRNDFMEHDGSDGSTPSERAHEAGYPDPGYDNVGENITAGTALDDPEEAVDNWIESVGHCENMMHEPYEDIGVGIGHNDETQYGYYWTKKMGID